MIPGKSKHLRDHQKARSDGNPKGGVGNVAIVCFMAGLTPRQENLARLFDSRGWEIRVITWDRGGGRAAAWTRPPWPVTPIRVNAPVGSARLLFRLPAYLWRLRCVLRSLQYDGERRTVVIATHFFHLFLAQRSPHVWIYDVAELFAYELSLYFGPLRLLSEAPLNLLERLLSRKVCAILTVDSRSEWLVRRYKKWGRAAMAVPNVPALADDPESEAAEDASVASGDPGGPRIAYTGGLNERKGLAIMIAAMDQLVRKYRRLTLILIGVSGNQTELEKSINKYGLQKNIIVREPMGYSQLLKYLSNVSIGLALYRSDRRLSLLGRGNGRKLFTYMQAGLAVVTTNEGEIGAVVSDSKCGMLVNPNYPEDVATAVDMLLTDGKRLKAMQENARTAFEKHWNWERFAPEVWRFLLDSALLKSGVAESG